MTLRQYLLRRQAYLRMWAEEWRRTRWLGYQVIKGWADHNKLPSITEIIPLYGDPTEEEQQAAIEEEKVKTKQWADDLVQQMIAQGTLKTNSNWKKDSK